MFANEKSFELEEKLEALKVDFEMKLKLQEEKFLREFHNFSSVSRNTQQNRSLKETFILWCENSDVNGISKIFKYESILIRFVLLTILLASLSMTAWIMRLSIVAYLQYGVVSQIGVIYEQPVEFPAVTFCDNEQFTPRKGLDFVKKFYDSEDCMKYSISEYVRDRKECALQLAANHAADVSYKNEKRLELGLNRHQLSCIYNKVDCTNDLKFLWHYEWGSCFQFNVGSLQKRMAYVEGIDYGLRIEVRNFTQKSIVKSGTNDGSGMKVYVHNRTAQPRWYAEGVYVRPGEMSMIGIKRTFVKNEPCPYTKCKDLTSYSSLLYDYIIKSNRTYRQKDCLDLCIQLDIIKECKCYATLYDNLNSNTMRPCLDLKDLDCFLRIYFRFDPDKCALEFCPLECRTIQ